MPSSVKFMGRTTNKFHGTNMRKTFEEKSFIGEVRKFTCSPTGARNMFQNKTAISNEI
jgi:hypothetical protein